MNTIIRKLSTHLNLFNKLNWVRTLYIPEIPLNQAKLVNKTPASQLRLTKYVGLANNKEHWQRKETILGFGEQKCKTKDRCMVPTSLERNLRKDM